jgi:hypothetical protein
MDIEKRFALLQNTYMASIAETVNTYDKLKVLDTRPLISPTLC